ncbi:alpha/beta hydrolase fold domain-containing protein [Kitasatospora griseola]|uniref:alpha/beta hydrolase fold domain-containing protein n=1 Tax=Kitasatospora griseola TaxID=2064 RepID=UPI0036612F42
MSRLPVAAIRARTGHGGSRPGSRVERRVRGAGGAPAFGSVRTARRRRSCRTSPANALRDEGEAYAARLRAAGVPVVAKRHRGAVHGFTLLDALHPTGNLHRPGRTDPGRRHRARGPAPPFLVKPGDAVPASGPSLPPFKER